MLWSSLQGLAEGEMVAGLRIVASCNSASRGRMHKVFSDGAGFLHAESVGLSPMLSVERALHSCC